VSGLAARAFVDSSGLHSELDFDCSCNLQLEVDFLMGLFERVINDSVAEFLR
jgi:hypothetical protein